MTDIEVLNAENARLMKLVIELRAEAVRLNAQAVPEISTEHGPWVESTIHEDETYCKRCLVRSVFAGDRKCEPHIVSASAAPQPAQPLDAGVMELAESVGLIGPASRTDDLHEAIQRFHDLIVVNASIKAARHFADGLAKPAQQPLTDGQRKFLLFLDGAADWDGVWFGARHPSKEGAFWWRRDMRQVFYGIGVKND